MAEAAVAADAEAETSVEDVTAPDTASGDWIPVQRKHRRRRPSPPPDCLDESEVETKSLDSAAEPVLAPQPVPVLVADPTSPAPLPAAPSLVAPLPQPAAPPLAELGASVAAMDSVGETPLQLEASNPSVDLPKKPKKKKKRPAPPASFVCTDEEVPPAPADEQSAPTAAPAFMVADAAPLEPEHSPEPDSTEAKAPPQEVWVEVTSRRRNKRAAQAQDPRSSE